MNTDTLNLRARLWADDPDRRPHGVAVGRTEEP